MKESGEKGWKKLLCMVVIWAMILVQLPQISAAQVANATQAFPMRLSIVIVEGGGAINNIQQRVAREVIVQVNDENDRPVGGALVLFGLPTSGPGGAFANGVNTLSVTTNAAGRATAAFTPNAVSGPFQINVTATFQDLKATAVIQQTNGSSGGNEGLSTTNIALIAAAIGGGVAIAILATRKSDDSGSPSAPTIRIGPGTPTLGAPGGWAASSQQVAPRPKWRD
jgi:hypothetical protein